MTATKTTTKKTEVKKTEAKKVTTTKNTTKKAIESSRPVVPPPINVEDNKAMLLKTVDDMQLVDYPVPELGDHDVLVAVKAVGICGSDCHYWKHGRIGDFVLNDPMVIGHESAGEVISFGKQVKGLKPGQLVAMEPGVPCDKCEQCMAGKYNLCPEVQFFATPPVHGSLQKYVSHPAKFCFPLPANVTAEMGACCEPLSVGVYACEQKAKVKPGHTVVVFGAGPIGTITCMVAHGMGAGKVILCDIAAGRLQFCKEMIPVETLDTTGMDARAVAEKIEELNGGKKVDSAVDCCGIESAISAAIYCTKNGGTVCLVGMGKPNIRVPLLDASCREVELQGVFRYRNTYPKCIELLSSGAVDVMPLITHRFSFTQESITSAFNTCISGKGADGNNAIKCMISVA